MITETKSANDLFVDLYSEVAALEITRSGKQRAQIMKLVAQTMFKETGSLEWNQVIAKCNEKIDKGV